MKKPPTITNDDQAIKAFNRLYKRVSNDRRLLGAIGRATGRLSFLEEIDSHLTQAQTMLRNFTGKDVK